MGTLTKGTKMAAKKPDYRNKTVRWIHEDKDAVGEPRTKRELKWKGKTGTAKSIYVDGRYSHDEGYLVEFAPGVELTILGHELEEVKPEPPTRAGWRKLAKEWKDASRAYNAAYTGEKKAREALEEAESVTLKAALEEERLSCTLDQYGYAPTDADYRAVGLPRR